MRIIVLVCLFVAAATAAILPEASYLPPLEKVSSEYLAPSEEVAEVKKAIEEPLESAALEDDGYRYKTVKTLKYRQRRDISELPNEYLPPSPSQELSVEKVSSEYIPAEVKEAVEVTEDPEESAFLGDDGYRYKTIRKLKYRQRRDVSEIVSPQYLPPSTEAVSSEYIPPAEVKEAVEITEDPEESAVLADDGYRYKTIRKLKYRQRRDVSEIVSPQYLPPSADAVASEYITPAEVKEAVGATEVPEDSAVLGDDGYRYKTIRKLKYRQRRDVSEIVSPQYLPPSADAVASAYIPPAEVKEAVESTEVPEDSAVLGDDGYRYKTIRKLKYRQRRDVSEIVSPQYLPPSADAVASEYIPPAEVKEAVEATEVPEDSAVLGDDGYRYKTIRKLKYRQRRDVSEIVSPQYLPPSADAVASEYIPPAEVKEAVESTEVPEDSAVLGDDGYRYKTIRKLKYRQRRDVSEIVSPQYLPPSADAVASEYIPPAEVKEAVEATEVPEDSAVLGDDGYRYKTIRKLKYRQRRDVSEIVSPQYLPPSADAVASEYIPPAEVKEAVEATEVPEDSAVLGDDGYRYKTIRKLKYRQRRDVSEIVSPQYLPPSADAVASEYIPPAEVKEAVEATEVPEDSAVLGDDGYRYKTIRKLKYRQRRDVSEIVSPQYLPPSADAVASEYIPPAEVKEAVESTEVPEDSAVLGDDGYRYKTIRKLKYRQRRDVSEIVSPQYLPPSADAVASEYIPPAEVKEAVEATEVPEDSAVLGDDGYRYKTIRKLKYRQRRDVSEIVSPQYLPPSADAVASEYIPPAEVKEAVEATEVPEDSAVLGDDGYRYKTIRKLKYRQRRDVSEIVSPQYLPPSADAVASEYIPPAEVKEAVEATEVPEDSAVLGDDGYRYKTIRKLKYRQRRDVSEIVSPQYLPPSADAVSAEYIPPAEVKEAVEATEAPEDSAVLADDGYRYKTIRKLKFRQRRDIS